MTEPGTVLITGPTRNLGRHAVLALAGRPESLICCSSAAPGPT